MAPLIWRIGGAILFFWRWKRTAYARLAALSCMHGAWLPKWEDNSAAEVRGNRSLVEEYYRDKTC